MNEHVLVILIVMVVGFLLVVAKYLPRGRVRTLHEVSQPTERSKASQDTMVPATIPSEALDINDEARFNFRNTRWEMSRDAVKKAEDFIPPVSEPENTLVFRSRVGHLGCLITYNFESDKLCGARYTFTPEYIDGARYLSDFAFLHKVLCDKFGQPQKSSIVWLNETFKNNRDLQGLALMEGHFVRTEEWLTQRTLISYTLGCKDGKVFFDMAYVPTKPPESLATADSSDLDDASGSPRTYSVGGISGASGVAVDG